MVTNYCKAAACGMAFESKFIRKAMCPQCDDKFRAMLQAKGIKLDKHGMRNLIGRYNERFNGDFVSFMDAVHLEGTRVSIAKRGPVAPAVAARPVPLARPAPAVAPVARPDDEDMTQTFLVPIMNAIKQGTDYMVRKGAFKSPQRAVLLDEAAKEQITALIKLTLSKMEQSIADKAVSAVMDRLRPLLDDRVTSIIKETVAKTLSDRLFWAFVAKDEQDKDEKQTERKALKREMVNES